MKEVYHDDNVWIFGNIDVKKIHWWNRLWNRLFKKNK